MQRTTRPTKVRRRAHERGRYKLAVFFIDHKIPNGKALYLFSNKAQDARGVSVNRFKRIITNKWKGLVNWAGIYREGKMISEFKLENDEWQER